MQFFSRAFLTSLLAASLFAGLVIGLSGCQSQTMTEAEKKFLLRGAVFQDYGASLPTDTSKMETFEKTGYFDSTYDLDYTFETPDDSSQPLYLNQSLCVAASRGEAITQAAALRGGVMLGMKSEKISEKAMPNEKIYGEGSKLTVLTVDNGLPIGNLFTARQGKRFYFLVVSGIYFDTPEDWDAFAGDNIRQWLGAK